MIENQFILCSYSKQIEKKIYSHKAPSNIALVKYWGKKEHQIPANPSISFTLSNCFTETSVEVCDRTNFESEYDFDFYFEGKHNEKFHPKLITFFKRIEIYLPFIKEYHLKINSKNSFPHSSGIASSASSLAALSICLMKIERQLYPEMTDVFFRKKASFLARLGSGSACRSIEGSIVVWGQHSDVEESSDLYGIPYDGKVHSIFENYQDTILLIDKGQKQVSSSQGHNLMQGHPFAQARFSQAHTHISQLKEAFQNGDLEKFMQIVESEALTLHSMMMTSLPYFILMKPNTLAVIEKIWDFRKQNNIPVCFTLDAGANVHILYPKKYKEEVLLFIENKLVTFCQDQHYICDEVDAPII